MENILKVSFLILVCFILLPASGFVIASQNMTANAGPNLYVTSGTFNSNPSAVLQGSGYDPNGGIVNFYWTCTDGTLSNHNIPQPLFTAPSGVWQSTVYTCTLTVTDNYGLSFSDSATIYVNYNSDNYNYNISAQTNNATNNYNSQATLNGSITGGNNAPGTIYAWFQWGTTTSYGYESAHKVIGYVGPFDQHIADLLPNTTYHFRVVAQGNYGTVYGQDMTFYVSGYGNAYTPLSSYNGGGQVAGASTVSTGLTNNPITDSFLLPLLLIAGGLWFYFSGKIYVFADKIKAITKKQ